MYVHKLNNLSVGRLLRSLKSKTSKDTSWEKVSKENERSVFKVVVPSLGNCKLTISLHKVGGVIAFDHHDFMYKRTESLELQSIVDSYVKEKLS